MYVHLTIPCPICDDAHPIEGEVAYDPGVWRDADGHGYPGGWEVDYNPTQCPACVENVMLEGRVEAAFITAYKDGQWR